MGDSDAASGATPVLEGSAVDAVEHRGGHVQIIASAGSGKTEVVSQRVASLVADGTSPNAIVAFTFTERAAAELKERIRHRVTERVGAHATDLLGQLQVSTIHAFCFRLLQTHVPTYESYSVLDENQLVALLVREGSRSRLDLGRFDPRGSGLFRGVRTFVRSVEVVENELLRSDDLPASEFRSALHDYYTMLERYRVLTYGQQVAMAIEALGDPTIHERVTQTLRHLIVDEYQDVNPAQERLIQLLAKPNGSADLVVVGDDDQAIYQWRGSNVRNIVEFADRYPDVTQFRLLENRRSRPGVIELANTFAATIPERLEKQMLPHRAPEGPSVQIAAGFEDEQTEADTLALTIRTLYERGMPYRDMAVLVRGRVAYEAILDAFQTHGVPVQPGGRTGLFEQDVAAVLGATFAWLADIDWASGRFVQRETVDLPYLLDRYEMLFELDDTSVGIVEDHLTAWKARVPSEDADVNLIGELYQLLGMLGVRDWDTQLVETRSRLGTIARFTMVLADYESVRRRARRDPDAEGEQVGGEARGTWYYRNLAILLVNYANGSYEDFEGEADAITDAVDLGTVHGAKGLEWPLVFLPSLTDGRFPSSRTGEALDWLVPTDLFDHVRYEGTDADERRLFYVSLTRARDWVRLSSHRRVTTAARRPSPYLVHAQEHAGATGEPHIVPASEPPQADLTVTYSELAAYLECPHSFLLRNRLQFMPPVAPELGYGNAVHHLMRIIAEHTKEKGALPSPREINQLFTSEFYLPFANKPAHKEMRERARQLVFSYVRDHPDELRRTWATERPFELYLDGVVVSGRADVIYDEHDGVPENLAIVDYKTSTGGTIEPLQLQIYADAGRREGLTVGAAFVHDMQNASRYDVPISDADVQSAESVVVDASRRIREGDFTPEPSPGKCGRCDVRALCRAAVV